MFVSPKTLSTFRTLALQSSYIPNCEIKQRNICGSHCRVHPGALGTESAWPRGDCAKDEEGAAAVNREPGANPTSVQGLNVCKAHGALPGNATTTADAIKAYVQAFLKSNFQTWIELPPS